jgi:hypothetical protein
VENLKMKTPARTTRRVSRRAAVAVECALVAPFLVSTALGIVQLTRAYDIQNSLETAVREGARFAAMDRDGMLQEGQTTNQKLISDVKNFLGTMGISPSDIAVNILDAENPSQGFDLDDPDNDLRLFQVDVSVPYSSISYLPVNESHDYAMAASITFRNGRATLSE